MAEIFSGAGVMTQNYMSGNSDTKTKTSLGTSEMSALYTRHMKTVYRVCFAYMKNEADTEDAVSDTFMKLIQSAPYFESEEHEKAWLIRTASNVCKNVLKHWRRKLEPLENHENIADNRAVLIEPNGVLEAVTELPEKYKTVVYLFYYEGYTGEEISKILKRPHSTVRNQLRDARKILKTKLGGDFFE